MTILIQDPIELYFLIKSNNVTILSYDSIRDITMIYTNYISKTNL